VWGAPAREGQGSFPANLPGSYAANENKNFHSAICVTARAVRKDQSRGEHFSSSLVTNYSAFVPVCASPSFSLENISCVVAYKVVVCNYGVVEQRAPAKTE
jgi:hypothetical protein